MDVVQFSLFFVALLVGYVLVHLRLLRFEEHMRKLSGIPVLDDRLRLLIETIEKLRLDRLEAHLERLHEDLQDVREATTEVQNAVVRIPRPAAIAAGADAPAIAATHESEGARLLAVVETRLLQLGYSNIQVLSDVSRLHADGDAEVQVECEKGGMPAKGRVLLRNGAVRDVALQTVAQMFP